MVIATRSSNRLQPIQNATPAKTPTTKGGKRRSECQLNKSPKSVNVNAILANINLLQTRFKTILTVLGPAAERSNETEDNPASPEHYNPADDKADNSDLPSIQISPPTSPNPEPTCNATVKINETSDSVPPPVNNPAMAMTPQAPCSILHGAPPAETTKQTTTDASVFHTANDPLKKTIHDRHRRLLINLGEDGHNKAFHVEDFVGLYPAWPIVEVAILPTENAKEERMNMFVKCITSLLGKILYFNDTAYIAPLEITNDNKDNYISDKAKPPSNFTKLGKWIMISGGSWVFNKKEKGSNNVYARFCLKSQVLTEEIINQVLFEFTHLGRTKIYKKQMQAMETETPMMLLFMSNRTDNSNITSDMKQLLELAYDDIKTECMMPEK